MCQTDSNCCGVLCCLNATEKAATRHVFHHSLPMDLTQDFLKPYLDIKCPLRIQPLCSDCLEFCGDDACFPQPRLGASTHFTHDAEQLSGSNCFHSPVLSLCYLHVTVISASLLMCSVISFSMFRAVSACRSGVALLSEINILNDVFPRRLLSL